MTLPATYELIRADGTILRYCRYGQADGYPVVSNGGSPSSRWKWPALIESMRRSKLALLVYDRPGYGGSTHRPGRTVADAADDVRALADAQGCDRFAVFGGSGCEELKLPGGIGDAVDAPARPALNQAWVDQSECHAALAMRRAVTSQALDPLGGIASDREPLADLRRGQLQRALDISAAKASTTGRTSA